MESLKVALASDWYYPKIGGIETHIHELALNLLEAGHEPHVITHDYRHHPGEAPRVPYPVHRFRGLVYVKSHHVSLGPGMLWEINKLYKREGFDVTHVHGLYSPLSIAVANLSRGIRGVGVVATNHSLYRGSRLVTAAATPLLRRLLRRVDVFIAVSSEVEKDTRRLLGSSLRDRPVYLIHNAIDTRFWRPPEPEERSRARRLLGIPEDVVLVLAVGRLTRRKRMHLVPRIVAMAAEKAGKPEKTGLLIVGDGEMRQHVREEIAALRSKLGYASLHGFVPREKLRLYYWASDVLLSPSPLEAFSITSAEAAATGLPVVGFRESGLRDVVVHGVTGYLARGSEEAAKLLAELLASEELRAAMGKAAAERAQRLFSWPRVLPQIIHAYRDAMDRAAGCDQRYILYKLFLAVKGALA